MRSALVLVTVTGCNLFDEHHDGPRDKPVVRYEKRPLEVQWTGDEAVLKDGGTIRVSGFRGTYHITLLDVPEGSTWKIGAQTGKASRMTLIDVAIANKLASLTFEELARVDPKATLELELADGRTGKTVLPPIDVTSMVDEMLKKAEHAPVLFGKEPEDPKQQDSMYWGDGLSDKRFYGKAGKLYELDWILVTTKLPDAKGHKTCGGYKDRYGNAITDITLILKETEATIYNRRTGEVVAKNVFPPHSECPMFTLRRAGETTDDSSTPYSQIDAWARTRVKR